jgi:hypothetical protein
MTYSWVVQVTRITDSEANYSATANIDFEGALDNSAPRMWRGAGHWARGTVKSKENQ